MAGIFVASYAVEVTKKYQDNPQPMTFAHGKTAYDELHKILVAMKADFVKPTKKPHLLRVTKLRADGVNLCGLIDRGEYGYSARGVRSDTYADSFTRASRDAELLPYYFRFHLPEDEHNGYMILQRIGAQSPYSDLSYYLAKRFSDSNPNFTLRVGAVVPAKLIQTLSEGKVRTLRVVTHQKTGDKADSFLRGTNAQVGSMEIVYRAKRDMALWPRQPAWMRDLISGKAKLATVYPEAQSIRVGVEYNGRTRQFDVSNSEDAAPYLDVTGDIELVDGHPKFSSIDEYCAELVEDLRQEHGMVGGAS